MYGKYENLVRKPTYTKPYDIKCGFAISSSEGRHLVFPTEEEAMEFLREREKEQEVIYS